MGKINRCQMFYSMGHFQDIFGFVLVVSQTAGTIGSL